MTEPRTHTQQSPAPPLPDRFGPRHMSGAAVEKARDRRGTLRRLWGYLRRHRRALLVSSAMVLVTTALNVLGPYLLGVAIDRFVTTGDLPGLARICLLMLAVYGLATLFTWLQAYVMAGVAQRTVRDIRADLFARLQRLPLRFFDTRSHGDLMSRLTNDMENVNQVLSDGVVQIVAGALGMVGVAAVMFALNPLLALVSILAISGMSLALNRWLAPRLRTGFRAQQAALGTLNGLIEETITGQRVVKAYHREPVVITQFAAANGELRSAATRAQIFAAFVGPLMNCVNNLGLAIVAGAGGWLALQGMATVGTIASFITLSRQFGRPLNELASLYGVIQSAVAGAERVFAVIDEPPESDAPDARPLGAIKGEVVFDGVRFGYLPDAPVLRGVSLRAAPGQTIALVGPTGAGKTTVVNLLTRFYDVDAGRITIDGVDLRAISKDDLRRQLGIVLQDTFLFGGTVLENIRYGRPAAPVDEVVAAAQLANADQFIQRLPQGYDTPLSERAGNLSQGQRQLLAIARAILADPRILILDEATSSVDTRTERHIQEAMLRLMQGRTSFVIAHRLSTIRQADQILVVVQGEIAERGTHGELLAADGFYARLYAEQLRGAGPSLAESQTELRDV
jgi:ATP-binding cassette subfamily B multidrug efflux pump